MINIAVKFVIVAALIVVMGACASTTSTPINNHVDLEENEPLDPKKVHRLEQRGYSTVDLVTEQEIDEEEKLSPVEVMGSHKGWTPAEFILDESVEGLFAEETIYYFLEDQYEKYPPPKNKTVDVIASIMYEEEDMFILHGLLRNGYQDRTFKQKDLAESNLLLVTQTGHTWIKTSFKEATGFQEIGPTEAKPFELQIPADDILLTEFDFNHFSYYASFDYVEVKEKKEKKSKKEKSKKSND